MTAREWLKAHGYDDVIAMIDEIMAEWKAAGSRERRDWWKICAGGRNGRQKKIAGRAFPVIRAFQMRLRMPVTPNAIWKSKHEVAPEAVAQARWSGKKTKKRKAAGRAPG